MSNKYDTFEDKQIKYAYPFEWKKRNKKYLEKVEDRKIEKVDEFPLEQDEIFCDTTSMPINKELERGNFLIINCGNSTDDSV